MASTANPFAYPPHITEDKTLCIDKAIVHTPIYCVNDILANKPENADVKLVILGTGKGCRPSKILRKKTFYACGSNIKTAALPATF